MVVDVHCDRPEIRQVRGGAEEPEEHLHELNGIQSEASETWQCSM